MLEKAYQLLEKNYDHMVKIRRYLHQHPELSFKEFETAFYTTAKTFKKGTIYPLIIQPLSFLNY